MNTTSLYALAFVAFSFPALAADLANCQPQLEASLCYGPAVEHWASASGDLVKNLRGYQERKCQPVPAKIKQTLVSVYQQFPQEVQQAFCEIKKVFIVTGDVSYGALADYYFDISTVKSSPGNLGRRFSGKPIGYVLEVSEKNRFKGESAPAYLTRVFQARFGNAAPGSAQLPVAEYDTPFGDDGALGTTIVHEVGHMLGRAQKVTSTYFLPLSEGNWSKITFKLDNGEYNLRYALPGYDGQMKWKLLSESDVQPTLNLFKKSGIASLYGGTSPQEDLAEFFMFHYYGKLKWNIQGQTVFDLQNEMATNPSFKAKEDIIRSLMILPAPFSLKNRGTVSGEIGAM